MIEITLTAACSQLAHREQTFTVRLTADQVKDLTPAEILEGNGWEINGGKHLCPLCIAEREEELAEAERDAAAEERYYQEEHSAFANEAFRVCKAMHP